MAWVAPNANKANDQGSIETTADDAKISASEARDPGGIIPSQWAASSRFTRAISSESAALVSPPLSNLAMGAIITVDAEQTIVNFNKAAEKMFGYAQEDIVGRELDMLIPERFCRVHARHIGDFKAPGIVSRVMVRPSARSVLSARRAGGCEAGSAFPLQAPRGPSLLARERLFVAPSGRRPSPGNVRNLPCGAWAALGRCISTPAWSGQSGRAR